MAAEWTVQEQNWINETIKAIESANQESNKRADVLRTAEKMVNGSRQQDYGTPEDNFKVIGNLWTAYTGTTITAHDVAIMMALLKIGRISSGNYNADNYIDLAGYAACAGEIAEEGVKA